MSNINKICWFGHSAIFLSSQSEVIAIDPWLNHNPACPKQYQSPQQLDLIVLSHGHSDHAGDVVRLAKEYNCLVCATFELANLLSLNGVPQKNIIGMNKGGSITWHDFTISLTHAVHSNSYTLTNGESKYAGEACGVVINDGLNSFYHAGDTDIFADIELIKEIYEPNYAFLPIGDLFTMGPRTAAMATKLCGSKTVIPIHYGTFPALTGTAEDFCKYCQEISPKTEVKILKVGEELSL